MPRFARIGNLDTPCSSVRIQHGEEVRLSCVSARDSISSLYRSSLCAYDSTNHSRSSFTPSLRLQIRLVLPSYTALPSTCLSWLLPNPPLSLTTLKVHPASHLHRIIIRHEFCWVCALFICIDPSPQPQTRHLRNPVITTHTWHEHSRLPLKHAPSAYLRVFCRGRRHPRRALRRPWWAGCATCLAGPCATARSQGSRSYNTHKRSSAAFVSFPP